MNQPLPNSFRSGPDDHGHFGNFGGRFVAETLMPLILDLEKAYAAAKADPSFQREMNGYLKDYVGRPSPLYFAERLTEHLGGAKIYLKREELNHTGSHKVNNVLGQIMVARRMGKKRIIAETGAGQHGVATATLCARFGLECVVYMGAVDVARQAPNVFRMEMLGAKVIPVQSGTRTLKDAMNEALRDWVTNVHNTFYCIGTVAGPHPYPMMVRDFQSRDRRRDQEADDGGRRPPAGFAGRLHRRRLQCDGAVPSLPRRSLGRDLWRRGGGPWIDATCMRHRSPAAARRAARQPHVSSDERRRPDPGRAFDLGGAGLSRHRAGAFLAARDRPRHLSQSATDDEALDAFMLLSRLEGIPPALESAHAIAKVMDLAPKRPKDHLMVVNLSGRGDKDIPQITEILKGRKQ